VICHVGWRALRFARVAVLALGAWLAAPVVVTADPPQQPVPPALREFGFDAQQHRALATGAIVTADVRTAMHKELMGSVAMRLPIPPADLAHRIRSGINVMADPKMSAYAPIDRAGDALAWRGVVCSTAEVGEARALAETEPGTDFNLSTAEWAAVRAHFAGVRISSDDEVLAVASDIWRDVLAGRFRSYRDHGPAGLAGYDRGASTSLPGDEIRQGDSAPYVPSSLAAFVRAIDRFPALPPGIDSRFFWKKTEIDDRPAFVLAHVLVEERADGVRFALREFYVSHTYNVLQQLGLVLPTPDGGSIVLAINSTITDRLPGMFTSLARSIGERRSRAALEDYFASIRRAIGADTPLSGG
jgi:hypothetical protein